MSQYGRDPMDFGRADDDYRAYHGPDDDAGRGPLILALAAGVLLVFAAVVWNTYRQGVRPDGSGLPIITASLDEFKRQPVDAGGAVTPDTERRIYDALDGSTRDEELDGGLRTTTSVTQQLDAETVSEMAIGVAPDPSDIESTLSDLPPPRSNVLSTPEVLAALESREPRRIAALDEATNALAIRTPVEIAPLDPDVSDAGRLTFAPRFQFERGGAYLVQIMALRSESRAHQAWAVLTEHHPDLFAGAEPHIQRADLGARGVFYRLRAGRFGGRDEAVAFCDALKSTGSDCIVVQ